jgi:hypothetical protein
VESCFTENEKDWSLQTFPSSISQIGIPYFNEEMAILRIPSVEYSSETEAIGAIFDEIR